MLPLLRKVTFPPLTRPVELMGYEAIQSQTTTPANPDAAASSVTHARPPGKIRSQSPCEIAWF